MTRKELLETYPDIINSEEELIRKFSRIKNRFNKKGYYIIKEGKGNIANYIVGQWSNTSFDNILQSTSKIQFSEIYNEVNKEQYKIFLGVASCCPDSEGYIYRGTLKDFLIYILKEPTKENIKKLENSLNEMVEAKILKYDKEDTLINDGVTLYLTMYTISRLDKAVDIQLLNYLKEIVIKYNKNENWIFYFFKIISTLWAFSDKEKELFNNNLLMEKTKIGENTLRECMKILEKENFFIRKKIFKTSSINKEGQTINLIRCKGQSIDFGAFDNGTPYRKIINN